MKRLALLASFLMLAGLLALPLASTAEYEGGAHNTGQSIANYVERISPYESWPLWPGTEKMYEGASPHGAFLTTYVNSVAYKAIQNKAGPLPNGSIIVKENYGKNEKLAAVTVMKKVKGFAPDSGNWFYIKYKPEAITIQAEGDVDSCRQCHAKVKDNDWLFTGKVMSK